MRTDLNYPVHTMRKTVAHLTVFLTVIGITLLHTVGVYAGSIVYDQPSVFPGPYSSWTSDRDVGGVGFRSWDDFRLSAPTLIDGVNWQGFYLDTITPGNNPTLPDTSSWELSLWSNVGGQPGVVLRS